MSSSCKVQAAAEQEKLEREEGARKILNEQELIMEEIVQESKRLQQESQENAKVSNAERACVIFLIIACSSLHE